jgi:hypothetical protein
LATASSVVAAITLSSPALADSTETTPPVSIHAEITINTEQQKVWKFISDYNNDQQWRVGVINMDVPQPLQIGSTVVETLKFPNGFTLVTPSILTTRVAPEQIILQTTPSNPFYVKNDRRTEKISDNATKFSNTLTVDTDLLAESFPGVPQSDVVAAYAEQMKTELGNAKAILESH